LTRRFRLSREEQLRERMLDSAVEGILTEQWERVESALTVAFALEAQLRTTVPDDRQPPDYEP
jgi:hypothetical protein